MGDCSAVSIVIPTRNRSELLKRAIRSALDSGEACGEVIVVDDGSTDDTCRVVASFTDERVRYLFSDSQGGPAARNRGFREARNDLIKFLDDDDFLVARGLERQLADFQKFDVATRDQVVIYGDALVTGRFFSSTPHREIASRRRAREPDVEYLTRVNIQTTCPLHQRHLLDKVGGFDESLKSSQENDLHLRLALAGSRFVRIPTDIYVFDNSSGRARISTQRQRPEMVEFRASLPRRRQQMLVDYYQVGMPLSIHQSLSRDFRECQRWARAAGLFDLELECDQLASKLMAAGSLESRLSGSSLYGLSRRVRTKAAKRVRGVVLSERWVRPELWMQERAASVPNSPVVRASETKMTSTVTNVSTGDIRSGRFHPEGHLSSEGRHAS